MITCFQREEECRMQETEGPVPQPAANRSNILLGMFFPVQQSKITEVFTLPSPPWTAMVQVTTSHRTRHSLSQLWLHRDEARGTGEDFSVLAKGRVENLSFPDTPRALVP